MSKVRAARATPKKAKRKAKPAVPTPDLRRVPTQARSKERFERILDAADAAFAEHGYDAATTEAIAARAGTSIGSVYQFFPNKKALFDSLCIRYMERAGGLFEKLLGEGVADLPWPELLDRVIDAFWKFHLDVPGFRAIWSHHNISVEMLEASDTVNRAIAMRSEEIIAAFAPTVPAARRKVVASVAVETVSALLFVAARRSDPEATRLIHETKALLRAYFASVLTEYATQR
jgi:AcrR family transcriptional regulator